MADFKVQIVDPNSVYGGGGELGPFPFDMFSHKCLAQGDSWFSLGSFPPGLTSNVLNELRLSKSTALVNCGRPSKTLAHMADRVREPFFLRLLTGKLAFQWDAILISGGGNDLIDAASIGPAAAVDKRLLLAPSERSAEAMAGADYVSQAGWTTFERHLESVFAFLMAKRRSGINKNAPTFFHNYAPIVPRNSAAGMGHGPWLQPALDAFGVPIQDWIAVSTELMARLNELIRRLVTEHLADNPSDRVEVVDTQTAGLVAAVPTVSGVSGDWQNEIHPTRDGYKKVAAKWRAALDPIL